ncbi:MAG: histone deacetylase [Methanoregulaceae archaeon]|nr:histone deacetylase [Methanoregulaceae archaeon]
MTARCSAIYGEIFGKHDIGLHAECSTRLREAIAGVPAEVQRREPVAAPASDLARVHTPGYIRMIRDLCAYGGRRYIDMNTYVTPDSFEVASYAAGSACEAVDRSLAGEHSFALVRPPGHHAEPDQAMGFCLFNNASVAAARALDRVERVAIVDWDLHHGNGTQKIFYESDRVLYCSIHQLNIFPRTGWVDEIGAGRGKGFNINAPIRGGGAIADYSYVFREVFHPAIEQFHPDVLIVSAGQDPLFDDPIGGMQLHPQDFGLLATLLKAVFDRPIAFVLEGGYGASLGRAVEEIFRALIQDLPIPAESRFPRESTAGMVRQLKKIVI